MPEINTGTGATTNIPTAPAAAVTADNAPKTYSQTEYDAQLGAGRNEVYHALGVTAENAASEIEAFKAWKAQQAEQKAQQPQKPETSAADDSGKRLSEMENRLTAMQRKLDAVNAGVPADKAERYVRLATSYMDDKTDFTAALTAALKDFPLPTTAPNNTRQFGGAVNGGGKTDKLPDEDKIKDIFAKR